MARRRDWVNNRIRLSGQSRGDPWLGGGQVADPSAADVARSRCGMGRYGMRCGVRPDGEDTAREMASSWGRGL
jgi:hypothetical protein